MAEEGGKETGVRKEMINTILNIQVNVYKIIIRTAFITNIDD